MGPVLAARVAAAVLAALCLLAVAGPAAAQLTEADVYVNAAIVEVEERQYDRALANLRRALEVEPGHVEALYYTGVVHMAQRRPDEAVRVLEQARQRSPRDPAIAVQLGLAYFGLQQYDRAQALLEEVFRTDPTLDGLGYYTGFLRYRNRDYRGALQAFRSGRASDPEIQQLTRLYTGLALAALGLPGQAAAEVEEALRIAPGSAITGPAERFRDAVVAARQRDRRLRVDVRLGMFYDDNVRVLPDLVGPGGDPLVGIIRDEADGSRDSIGELLSARVEYAFLRTEQWELSIGYTFFYSYYNSATDFNVMNHLGSLSGVYKTAVAGMPLALGGQYAYDALFLDEEIFVQRHTATLYATLVPGERTLTQAVARYQAKNFNETGRTPSDEFRDASNWMLGLLELFRFSQDRHHLKVGYQIDYDDTTGRNYEYVGHRFLAGGQYTLPWWGIRLRYDLDVHLRDYLNVNTVLPSNAPGTLERYDREFNHNVRVEAPLPYNLTLVGEYLRTDAHSNLDVFDYTRNVWTLSLNWTY
jgi:tetratricopeptide (TPR) repeat protein